VSPDGGRTDSSILFLSVVMDAPTAMGQVLRGAQCNPASLDGIWHPSYTKGRGADLLKCCNSNDIGVVSVWYMCSACVAR
jgi:hypothetical protein